MLFDVERGREGINGFDFTKSAFERFDFSLNIAKLPSGSNLNFFFFFEKKASAWFAHGYNTVRFSNYSNRMDVRFELVVLFFFEEF